MKKLFLLATAIFFSLTSQAQLQSPSEFLPHELGAQFTPHHMLVQYMEHVAQQSPLVELTEYGRTNKDRPLLLAYIGSTENLDRLDAIRENNLKRTGLLDGATDPALNDILVIWLSFGVHGNEAAGPESAMNAIYELLTHPDRDTWLANTVICYDPTINPDGYDRYTHWYRNVSNTIPDPKPSAREHDEPWPGGRVNHYLFDLNRDWAWQTQVESRQRMARFNQWLPQVHVDVHEQGYNSPYYFAPAAPPFHAYITDWQAEFQETIGKNHARYFDENGWLFFTKERFDLLYPSYGDTYPTYNGAIGMTYEQGGIGAGRAVIMDNGDTLTLYDRIAHHTTTVLSTIEISSQHADKLIEEFTEYWSKAQSDPPGNFKTFVLPATNSAGRLASFTKLLDRNGIEYGRAGSRTTLTTYDYQSGATKRLDVQPKDLVISAYQPKAVLTQILLEPETFVEDSITYDITAWSLPYAYGLEAYASTQRLDPQQPFEPATVSVPSTLDAYAYLLAWDDLSDARFLAEAIQRGFQVRYAAEPFRVDNKDYDRGTLVITRADNRKRDPFDEPLQALARKHNQNLVATQTGYVQSGSDFGSGNYRLIEAPKALLLSGESTRSNSFGQAWYYFEQDIGLDVTVRDADQLSRIDLDEYNTLILVDGRYRWSESVRDQVGDWISGGGHVIAVGSAAGNLAGQDGFSLQRAESISTGEEPNNESDYAGQERRYISNLIPGAIFKVHMDGTHPLAYGMGDHYFTLKTSGTAYAKIQNGWNVGTLGEDLMISGFAGQSAREAQKNTAVFAVQSRGRGAITYMVDNPLYRSFWEQGKFLFSNALFFVGN